MGGHLTALRRTASGPFAVAQAAPVEEAGAALLAGGGVGFLGLTEAATTVFPARALTEEEARALSYGQRIPATGAAGPHAAVDPDGPAGRPHRGRRPDRQGRGRLPGRVRVCRS